MTTAISSENPVVIAWPSTPVPEPGLQGLEAVLTSLLDRDERILWCAQPDAESIQQLESSKSTAWWAPVVIGVGILAYVAYTIIGQAKTLSEDPSNLMNFWMPVVIGVVTLGIGIVSLTSPLRSKNSAKYTLYAVTNERAIVLEPGELPKRGQTKMHWKFTGVVRTALRDIQSRPVPGKADLQDVGWTYNEPLPLEARSRQKRGELAVEQTVKVSFLGVPAQHDVEHLLRSLRSGSV